MPQFRRIPILAALAVLAALAASRADTPRPWPSALQRGANLGGTNYSEQDIAHLALDWRANSVRILVNDLVPASAPYLVRDSDRQALFGLIDLCLKYHLYTVVSFSASFDDHDAFFANNALRAAFAGFWKEVAARYATAGPIAYDLMNEPHDQAAETEWSRYARELTDSIRAVDSVHTIVVEPPGWGWPDGFSHLTPTGDPNTVYSFHFYGPMDFTHQRNDGPMSTTEAQWKDRDYPGFIQGEQWDQARMRTYIDQAAAFRDKYRVKIWCGEFGCARWAIGARQWFADWVGLLEEESIGWSYYSYREWHHMDLEMDPAERVSRTARSETELVGLFRGFFARNAVPADFDRDGELTAADALELLRFQRRHPGSLAADYNADGRANVLDALALLLGLWR